MEKNLDQGRHVTWLENFYDLIVVVVVAQVSVNLSHDVSLFGFIGFIALYIPIWWSWVGATFYATRFEIDDLGHRLLILLQIAASAYMAVNVPRGLGEDSSGFALSYAIIRIILVVEYIRVRRLVPEAAQLIKRYSIGFSIAAVLWFVSAFIPPPFRFIFWTVGLVIDISIPLIFTRSISIKYTPDIHHLPERFGAFTIIVLGISILGVVNGISNHNWSTNSIIDAGLGLGIAFSLWWVYFDRVDGAEIKALRSANRFGVYIAWLYVHFPLIIGFTALGVSIEHVVLSNQDIALPLAEKWLLCISVSICLFAISIIDFTTEKSKAYSSNIPIIKKYSISIYGILAAIIVIIIATIGTNIIPVSLMSTMAIICIGQVILDIRRHPHHRIFKL
jgi:low temperature requirement protein LtrA